MRFRGAAPGVASRCSVDILGGRYRLDGLLGSGGAADVYRGFDLRLRRPVAVKVFRPDTGFDAEEGAHGEAVILAGLHHPGLVSAYDAGQHGGRAFLVMQLVDGATLKQRINRGLLSARETAVLGAEVANALAHAHAANIVHRDVKPSNILLDACERPYLTDFGISRRLDATRRTVSGTLTGTAAYLSPEQVLGRPVGRPCDIYALGLVLLECLTGRLEYEGGPLESAIARLHRKPQLPEHLPEDLANLVMAMTALDEDERPTASDCALALARPSSSRRPATTLSSAAMPAGPVVGGAAEEGLDRTHSNPLPSEHQGPSGFRSVRWRTLSVGACAAITAAAAVFACTGDSLSHGDDQSSTPVTSSPARPSKSSGHVRSERATAAARRTASDREAGADGTPNRQDEAAPGPSGSGPFPHRSGTPQRAHAGSGAPHGAGSAGDSSLRAPGQSKKTAKPEPDKAKKPAAKR
ncbi:protein kinase domain-containing protein [Streptomyces sp. NPDC055109]